MTKEERIKELRVLTGAFCRDNLNKELNSYVGRLIDMLNRNENYDICKGKIEILASALVCVIARLNLLFDDKSKLHISIDKICEYYGTNSKTVEMRAKKIESACNILLGHEGLCGEEISDAFTFLEFENGTIITKAMAKQHGII